MRDIVRIKKLALIFPGSTSRGRVKCSRLTNGGDSHVQTMGDLDLLNEYRLSLASTYVQYRI